METECPAHLCPWGVTSNTLRLVGGADEGKPVAEPKGQGNRKAVTIPVEDARRLAQELVQLRMKMEELGLLTTSQGVGVVLDMLAFEVKSRWLK